MSRRLVVAAVVVLVFVAGGAALALLTRDDSPSTSASGSTTSSRPPTTTSGATTTIGPTTTSGATATTTTPALPDPCGADGGAIRAAIDAGIAGARDGAQVDQCRLAAVDSSWAAVRLVAKAGSTFSPVTVVLHSGGGSWTVVANGMQDVGCGTAPQQVLVDLGILCSSSGGGQ